MWIVYAALLVVLFAVTFVGAAQKLVSAQPQNPASVAGSWLVLNEIEQEVAAMRAMGKSNAEIDDAIAITGFKASSLGPLRPAYTRSMFAPHYRLLKLSNQGFVYGYFPEGFDRDSARKLIANREPMSEVTPPVFVTVFQLAASSAVTCILWVFGPILAFWIVRWVWRGFRPAIGG